ncbi:AAA family ATPase [Nocardioides speluncae]|uniref:AAA family ATPase n=1 Tax=Nocardioides speluncae TaxID=2670337 RepID=UPI000D69DCE3|nr:P-loop NTPase [Nocardioides speluncae]
MTVILERDPDQAEQLQAALGGGATVVGSFDAVERHLAAHPREYAVVLGAGVELDAATGFAHNQRITRPALGVILVRSRVDSNILGDALRSGMREVVELRDLTGLAVAVRRVHEVSQAVAGLATPGAAEPAPGPTGTLVTVFSTKGGVGKTTVATNLGTALADHGHRVCLVDLDVHGGDVAIMLQLFPTRSLSDLASLSTVDQGGVESVLTEHSERLCVLAAPLTIDAKDQVSAAAVTPALHMLKQLFDVVVVDTSGQFDDFALDAFDQSDLLVLVGTLDIPSLKNLKLATGTLDLLNIPREDWRLVLNRADAKVGLSPKEVEETLGLEIVASIPSSRDILAAVNRGEAIVQAQPKHSVSRTFIALARSLVERPPADHPESSKGRGSRRLRSKQVH